MEHGLVSMDTTSLITLGLVIACLASTDGEKCTVSKIEGLNPAVILSFKELCDLKCYACSSSAEIDKIEPCPESGCPDFPITGHSVSACPASIAYVLHTSGTTGRPRMVQVPHCCILPNIIDLRAKFSITPGDIIFNAAPLTFDPCFVEVQVE